MEFIATNEPLTPKLLNKLITHLQETIPEMPPIAEKTVSYDYEAEFQIVSLNWSKNYHISEDHGDYVLDFDADKNVIGIELLDFNISKFS